MSTPVKKLARPAVSRLTRLGQQMVPSGLYGCTYRIASSEDRQYFLSLNNLDVDDPNAYEGRFLTWMRHTVIPAKTLESHIPRAYENTASLKVGDSVTTGFPMLSGHLYNFSHVNRLLPNVAQALAQVDEPTSTLGLMLRFPGARSHAQTSREVLQQYLNEYRWQSEAAYYPAEGGPLSPLSRVYSAPSPAVLAASSGPLELGTGNFVLPTLGTKAWTGDKKYFYHSFTNWTLQLHVFNGLVRFFVVVDIATGDVRMEALGYGDHPSPLFDALNPVMGPLGFSTMMRRWAAELNALPQRIATERGITPDKVQIADIVAAIRLMATTPRSSLPETADDWRALALQMANGAGGWAGQQTQLELGASTLIVDGASPFALRFAGPGEEAAITGAGTARTTPKG